MKKCPKCGKEYDLSWDVCLSCKEKLITDPKTGGLSPVQEEILSEIRDIRSKISGLSGEIEKDVTRLNERLNALEFRLKGESAAVKPAPAESPKPVQTKAEEYSSSFKQIFAPSASREDEQAPETHEEEVEVGSAFKEEVPKQSFKGSFEQILGGRLFSKLGTFAVVVGMALLLGYSFKYFGPAVKIAVGYLIGAGLVLFGAYLDKKEGFPVYARTLIGGGWALTYFTTFAMHHIPAVRLIENPLLGFLLLMAVAAATVVHITKYRSQVATGFAYLLIFITLMVQPVTLYTIGALVLVALSFVYMMYRFRWNEFVIYGIVMSYISYMTFLARSPRTEVTDSIFAAVYGYLAVYWLIFSFAGFIMKNRDDDHPFFNIQSMVFIANSLFATVAVETLALNGFDKYRLFMIGANCGLNLAATAIAFFSKKRNIYIVTSTFAAFFACQLLVAKFSGYSLTIAYVVLAQVILLAGILLRESYWRKMAAAFLVLIFCKLLFVDSLLYALAANPDQAQPNKIFLGLNSRMLLFSGAFLFFLLNHTFYLMARKRDVVPASENGWIKVVSYSYPAIFALGTWMDLPKVLTAPVWAVYGIIMLQIGVAKDNVHQRVQGYFFTVGSFCRLLMSNLTIEGGISGLSYRLITALPVAAIFQYCKLLLDDTDAEGKLASGEKKMVAVYRYLIFAIIMLVARYELPTPLVAPIWSLIAATYLVIAVLMDKKHYLPMSAIAVLAAGIRAIFMNVLQDKYLTVFESSAVYPLLTVAVIYACNIFSHYKLAIEDATGGALARFFRRPVPLFSLTATAVLTVFIVVKTTGVYMTACLGIEGLLLCVAGFLIREKSWRISGLVVLTATLAKVFLVDLRKLETIYYILSLIGVGAILLFISFIYTKYKSKIETFYK